MKDRDEIEYCYGTDNYMCRFRTLNNTYQIIHEALYEDVYSDMLHGLIEKETGLALTL